MKKIILIIAAVAMLSLVTSSAVYADGFAPGEGLYLGGFIGAASGIVQPKVTTTAGSIATGLSDPVGGTYEATEGGIGLMGMEGGGMLGYGYKMGDFYAGLEGETAWGDVEFELTSDTGVDVGDGSGIESEDVTNVKATKDWTGGMFGRVGFYVNPNTLFSFRGGVLVSKFDVSYTGQSETYYGGGPSFGVSLESTVAAIDPNLNVRIGAVYTDFLTAPVSGIGDDVTARGGTTVGGSDSEVTGAALSARVGLTYSFFDMNSIF